MNTGVSLQKKKWRHALSTTRLVNDFLHDSFAHINLYRLSSHPIQESHTFVGKFFPSVVLLKEEQVSGTQLSRVCKLTSEPSSTKPCFTA